jgi:SPP1 gp7 family putative phage head morphogenesis protein
MWGAAFDVVSFPEAVDWFARRTPITDAAFRRNVEQAHRQAFWIAGVTRAEVIRSVFDDMKRALEQGIPFDEWKRTVGPKLEREWLGNGLTARQRAHRTELVLRNWSQNAYNRARWDQMNEPSVKRFRPYALFDGVKDSRQSEICKACNDTCLPIDHPWWDSHRPPLHHACRSGIRSLTTARAQARGITKDPPDVAPAEGFGSSDEYRGPKRRMPKGVALPPKPPAQRLPPQRPKRRKPQEPTPIQGRPPETFRVGTHVGRLEIDPTTPRDFAEQALAGLTQDDLKLLQRRPLNDLRLRPSVIHEGSKVNGLYWNGRRRLEVSTERLGPTFGRSFTPGESWSVSTSGTSQLDAVRRTLVHELGHHVHDSLGADGDQVVRAAFLRAQTPVTKYASTNRHEYFAESFAAFRYHRAQLKAHDPNGYAMVVDVLRLHGIEAK